MSLLNGRCLKYVIFPLTILSIISDCKPKETQNRPDAPHIIYILADDLGYGDLTCLNSESKIPTPNLDRISNNGVYFTDFHTNAAVCTPTRYGILTGRYAFRTRLKEGVIWGYSPPLISQTRITVPSFLRDNGYITACIGKWHLGLNWVKKDPNREIKDLPGNFRYPEQFEDNVDYNKPVKGGAVDHGFDYSLIIPASLDMSPYCYINNARVFEPPSDYTWGRSPEVYGRGVFWRQGKISPGFDFSNVTPTFIDSACQFITRHANRNKPFFLYLALPSPHTPWMPAEEYLGISDAGRYGDFVVMIDHLIGKIIRTVEDEKIENRTLIIFTSDNGADWRPRDIENTGHRSNYIFKGRKGDIYEGGHRVPFIAQWKGVIPQGSHSDEVMCSTDLLATLAGMLNIQVPDSAGEDSDNLWPAFIGEVKSSPVRNVTIHHSSQGIFSIRKGRWKYTPHLGSGGKSVPKEIIPEENEAPGTLYDLEMDPKEENNLYKEYPKIVKELSLLLEKYKTEPNSW